jgi:hypothetical protein
MQSYLDVNTAIWCRAWGLRVTGRPLQGSSRHVAGWITVKAEAVARRRIAVMGVYAFDSGPGALRGAVWIDSVKLFAHEPKRR